MGREEWKCEITLVLSEDSINCCFVFLSAARNAIFTFILVLNLTFVNLVNGKFMKVIQLHKKLSDDEYFLFEEKSELRHELINGNLYEMSGISIFHNDIVSNLLFLFHTFLKGTEWKLVFESFKVKTPEGNYFYPDIAVCYSKPEKYFSAQPLLIVEVLSDTTRKYDLTDKFIQYQKIETLEYYLCVEPEQQVVVFYYKQEDGDWTAEALTKDEQIISLSKLNISFPLKDIYNP